MKNKKWHTICNKIYEQVEADWEGKEEGKMIRFLLLILLIGTGLISGYVLDLLNSNVKPVEHTQKTHKLNITPHKYNFKI